jgi:uncharacterized protein YmfQ (DUF2313 family)
MSKTASNYLDLLRGLLPLGYAWNRVPGSVLTRLLAACAEELARLEADAWRALEEINPLTTLELLPEWEAIAGLPDECSPTDNSDIAARRQALIGKLRRPVGQDAAFFERLAAAYGYPDDRVEEFFPFSAEVSGAEDALNDAPGGLNPDGSLSLYDGWLYTWLITLGEIFIREFCAEDSGAEDPLRQWGDDGMECRIIRAAPAHTVVLFGYGEGEMGSGACPL